MHLVRKERKEVRVGWSIKQRKSGVWVPVWEGHNLMTEFGLTGLASAFGGLYDPPIYLVIDDFSASIQNVGTLSAGATSVTLDERVDEDGDEEIVLGVGTANEEARPFSAVTGSGPYIYTISATAHDHAHGDLVCRQPMETDTIDSIQSEIQYSPIAFPGKRAIKSGNGFSSGTGNHVMSFFITGGQAIGTWMSLGTSESPNIGDGNLHNHLVVGFDHEEGNDTQIDISLTLSNGS